jgi:hypothetical protein
LAMPTVMPLFTVSGSVSDRRACTCGRASGTPPLCFSQVLILNVLKVLCFYAVLQVFILKDVREVNSVLYVQRGCTHNIYIQREKAHL